ncbi:hypothetical protein G6027_10270 [Dietzia sp. SLG310A2-38A2]|uniref:hypothetical protein n=1 Tax=Dietzia sp. SLG310A2-38A2 TaxID=1630643 RepID=UPI0015FE0584|nr:hypothetical protein [Dietzia sp. SLG310A2-38A2]MBB1031265.1 hypothetical protein [Dietzia sp. SLG310A2-38A2]
MIDLASTHHHGRPIDTTFDLGDKAIRLLAQARDPFPIEVALAFSDWAHQLRAALDAILYQLAVKDSGQNPPPGESRLQYPLATNRAAFDREARRRLKHLSTVSIAAIERTQPYNIPTKEHGHALWWLHEVARIDRHRLAHEFAWNVRGVQLDLRGLAGAQVDDCDHTLTYVTHKQKTWLATITPPPGAHPQLGSSVAVVTWPEIPRWHSAAVPSYRQYGLTDRMTNVEELIHRMAQYFAERAGS